MKWVAKIRNQCQFGHFPHSKAPTPALKVAGSIGIVIKRPLKIPGTRQGEWLRPRATYESDHSGNAIQPKSQREALLAERLDRYNNA